MSEANKDCTDLKAYVKFQRPSSLTKLCYQPSINSIRKGFLAHSVDGGTHCILMSQAKLPLSVCCFLLYDTALPNHNVLFIWASHHECFISLSHCISRSLCQEMSESGWKQTTPTAVYARPSSEVSPLIFETKIMRPLVSRNKQSSLTNLVVTMEKCGLKCTILELKENISSSVLSKTTCMAATYISFS